MIKSILVPIDGSPSSLAALTIASDMAALADAKLTGLFVKDERRFMHLDLQTAVMGSIGIQPITETHLPAKEMLEEDERVEGESEELQKLFDKTCLRSHISGKFVTKRGITAEAIIEEAKRVDIIIIGNSGTHSGLKQIKSGFTTNSLVHATTRPVFVIPEGAQGTSTIVLAYDGSAASERALRVIAELATLTQIPNVHILTVTDDAQNSSAIQEDAQEYLSAYDLTTTRVSRQGKADQVIRDYVKDVDASILAIGAFGSNKLKEKIFGSTTAVVLNELETAILLIP